MPPLPLTGEDETASEKLAFFLSYPLEAMLANEKGALSGAEEEGVDCMQVAEAETALSNKEGECHEDDKRGEKLCVPPNPPLFTEDDVVVVDAELEAGYI